MVNFMDAAQFSLAMQDLHTKFENFSKENQKIAQEQEEIRKAIESNKKALDAINNRLDPSDQAKPKSLKDRVFKVLKDIVNHPVTWIALTILGIWFFSVSVG